MTTLADEDVAKLNGLVAKFTSEFTTECTHVLVKALKRSAPPLPIPNPAPVAKEGLLEQENKRLKTKVAELEATHTKFAKHVFGLLEAGERKFCGALASVVPTPKKVEPKKKKASKKKTKAKEDTAAPPVATTTTTK